MNEIVCCGYFTADDFLLFPASAFAQSVFYCILLKDEARFYNGAVISHYYFHKRGKA